MLKYIFAFRLINSLFFSSAYICADEYWQSLEVAHGIAFGYGYRTWEWESQIRSAFLPGMLIENLGLGNTILYVLC